MNQNLGIQNPVAAPSLGAETSLRQMCVDFTLLMKPGILVLLLISTACPMFLAAGGAVPLPLLLWTLAGGALISGSASVLNCIWDKDIDTIMERTKNRPLPAGRLSPAAAAVFAFITGLLGLVLLAQFANPLAASIALFGHFFYVLVYTIWLKRTTPQNIVIGGAAGAVPPMVGWAAVTGEVGLAAWLIFLVVFLWTPPHFWALALNKNSDYQRAGIPMLPVVSGERATQNQMLLYSLALIPVTVLLVITDQTLGMFSLLTMGLLSAVFAYKCYQLRMIELEETEAKTKKAWDIFRFSLIYLGLFFVCMVIDSVVF